MTETIGAMMDLIPTATAKQLADLSALLESDAARAPAPSAQASLTPDGIPLAEPASTPVPPPVEAPITEPASTPVPPPIAAPIMEAVATPVTPAVVTPVTAPVAAPITEPASTPVPPPIAAPITEAVATRVTPPVATPVTPPVAAPVTPPAAVPVIPPVAAPVARSVVTATAVPPDRGFMSPGATQRSEMAPYVPPVGLGERSTATPSSPVVVRPSPRAAELFARGQEAERAGDMSGARRLYAASADQGNATAARSLGRLYDPAYLKQTALGGIDPDPALARRWYERAVAMGDAQAAPLLQALAAR
jgi:hypothetical protein